MKLYTQVKCPACSLTTKMVFNKPRFMEGVRQMIKCSGCESILTATVVTDKEKTPEKDNTGKIQIHMKISVKVSVKSKMAQDIEDEEALARMSEEKTEEVQNDHTANA